MNVTTKMLHSATAIAALSLSSFALAQPKPLETAAGWKAACETSPDNVVVLAEDITVSPLNGANAASAAITTKCTIQLLNDASLQLSRTTFTFGGPLVITGGAKTALQMDRAELTATNVDISLLGEEGQIMMKESRINARQGGNFALTLGAIAKMEISGLRTNYEGNRTSTYAALFAEGDLAITVGPRFSTAISEGHLFSQRNLSFSAPSGEANFKLENATTYAPNGSLTFAFGGSKNMLEASNAPFFSGTDLEVVMSGAESSMSFSNARMTSGGAIELNSNGDKAGVKMSNGFYIAPAGFFASAGLGGSYGELLAENVAVNAGTPISFSTGTQGSTIVKNSTLTSTGHVVVSGTATGKCESIGLRLTAVTSSICQ